MFQRTHAALGQGILRAWSGLRGSIWSAVMRLPPQLGLLGLLGLGSIVALSALSPLAQLVATLGCCIAAARVSYPTRVARFAPWLILPVLLWSSLLIPTTLRNIEYGLTATLTAPPRTYTSDAMYYNHYDALLVLRGINPYVGDHLADAILTLNIAGYTPIARGRFRDVRHYPTGATYDAPRAEYLAYPQQPPPEVDPRTVHSYPAGAFLVDVPFLWAGLPSIAFPQVVLFLLLGIALVAAAPPGSRVGVAVLVLAARTASAQVTGWDFDIWPLALVIGAWLLADRRIASSLLLGAACAFKQTIWFVVPFYLVWSWRTQGGREVARRGAIALASFVGINLPWMVASPREWFASLWLPMSLPLFPGAVGSSPSRSLAHCRSGRRGCMACWSWGRWRAPSCGIGMPSRAIRLSGWCSATRRS